MEARFPDGRTIPFHLNKSNSIGRGATADVFFSTVGDEQFAAKIYKSEHKFDVNKISNMTRLEEFSNNPMDVYGLGHKAFYRAVLEGVGQDIGLIVNGEEGKRSKRSSERKESN